MNLSFERSYPTPLSNSTLLPLLLLSLARQRHSPEPSLKIKREYDYIIGKSLSINYFWGKVRRNKKHFQKQYYYYFKMCLNNDTNLLEKYSLKSTMSPPKFSVESGTYPKFYHYLVCIFTTNNKFEFNLTRSIQQI